MQFARDLLNASRSCVHWRVAASRDQSSQPSNFGNPTRCSAKAALIDIVDSGVVVIHVKDIFDEPCAVGSGFVLRLDADRSGSPAIKYNQDWCALVGR
jgi:hypothetical protein